MLQRLEWKCIFHIAMRTYPRHIAPYPSGTSAIHINRQVNTILGLNTPHMRHPVEKDSRRIDPTSAMIGAGEIALSK
jgi:hypothetical protein